ncbi:MAG: copper resistance protein B [Pseudomonadota bacterium]|tara:strand:- start:40589 stop:41539 length:951 start_codon:yes stop_codon:yes gene_type:complete
MNISFNSSWMRHITFSLAILLGSSVSSGGAFSAESISPDKHMPAMQHGGSSEHGDMKSSDTKATTNDNSMSEMSMGPMQGGSAPANARSPDYSDGVGYGSMKPEMGGSKLIGMVLIDQLEAYSGRNGHGVAWGAEGWYGNDENKFWVRTEGEGSSGRIMDANVEAFWNHTIGIFWGSQLGIRHDFGVGPSRDWLAFGVQGLSPYWFELRATGYVGPSGRMATRLQASYEILFTQKLILQPELEANLYSKDDPARGVGRGLSDVQLGLRLRYEIRRQFAPYVGMNLVRKFGRTADFARADGENAYDPQLVAGIRLWF